MSHKLPLPTPEKYPVTSKYWGIPDARYEPPFEALFRIQRALVGHVSFLAAVEANAAFSELLLYETILRVLMIQGYEVEAQKDCEYRTKKKRGPSPTIDFVALVSGVERLALEVKWPRLSNSQVKEEAAEAAEVENRCEARRVLPKDLKIVADTAKLGHFLAKQGQGRAERAAFLCVFGRWNHIGQDKKELLREFHEYYSDEYLMPVVADLGRTRFACRIFQRNGKRFAAAEID